MLLQHSLLVNPNWWCIGLCRLRCAHSRTRRRRHSRSERRYFRTRQWWTMRLAWMKAGHEEAAGLKAAVSQQRSRWRNPPNRLRQYRGGCESGGADISADDAAIVAVIIFK